jgi:glycosyltransferase involved in cell wall biosynthesis
MSARRYDLAIVVNYYHPYLSGVAQTAKVVAEGLTERGFAVAVVTAQYDDRLARREQLNGVDVFRAPIIRKIGRGFLSPALTRIAREVARRSRMLHVHLPMLEAALLVRGIGETPVMSRYHIDLWMPTSPLSAAVTRVVNASVSRALRASVAVTVNSHDQIVQSVHRETLARANLQALPAPCTDRRGGTPRFRETPGRHIGFLGRVVPDKGIDALVRAFRRIDDPQARLLIAGDYTDVAGGSTIDLVRAEAAGDDRVRILGPLTGSNINDFYASIDVFGLPSVVESFGQAQAEAIMTGVPSVTVNLPGGRIPVTETGLGVLIEPGADTTDLYEALRTAAQISPERRQEAARKARELFGVPRFLDAYQDLLLRYGIDAPVAAGELAGGGA